MDLFFFSVNVFIVAAAFVTGAAWRELFWRHQPIRPTLSTHGDRDGGELRVMLYRSPGEVEVRCEGVLWLGSGNVSEREFTEAAIGVLERSLADHA